MADKDLRHCPFCGRFFIENTTFDAPDRCPGCRHDLTEAAVELPDDAEAVLFDQSSLDGP